MFGGSGSEVISAIRLGLRYVTFEKEPKYAEIIRQRATKAERIIASKPQRSKRRQRTRPLSDFEDRSLSQQATDGLKISLED
jgi:DNA modification methylase